MTRSRQTGNNISKRFRVVIAGGGTGGHLFPGIAIAEELKERLAHVEILFIVGRRPMEARILARYGYRTQSIDVEGISGRGIRKRIAVFVKLPNSLFQSFSAIGAFKPNVVLGVGGYSSGPFCLVSWLLGIPTAIHEQNAYPGLTNRLLGKIANRVFISLEESRGHFDRQKTILTGNPVRKVLFSREAPMAERDKPFSLLVMGGSQGAKAINEIFIDALEILKKENRPMNVLHQTGQQDKERAREAYKRKGLSGKIVPFIDDMAGAYGQADMVISRAGATTLFELAAMGKPAILIPYPFATHHHQEINAASFVKAGGAEMVLQDGLTGEKLAQILMKYMDDPTALARMAECAHKMSHVNAASHIVDQMLEMAGDRIS